jgi:hypothetical protein
LQRLAKANEPITSYRELLVLGRDGWLVRSSGCGLAADVSDWTRYGGQPHSAGCNHGQTPGNDLLDALPPTAAPAASSTRPRVNNCNDMCGSSLSLAGDVWQSSTPAEARVHKSRLEIERPVPATDTLGLKAAPPPSSSWRRRFPSSHPRCSTQPTYYDYK